MGELSGETRIQRTVGAVADYVVMVFVILMTVVSTLRLLGIVS